MADSDFSFAKRDNAATSHHLQGRWITFFWSKVWSMSKSKLFRPNRPPPPPIPSSSCPHIEACLIKFQIPKLLDSTKNCNMHIFPPVNRELLKSLGYKEGNWAGGGVLSSERGEKAGVEKCLSKLKYACEKMRMPFNDKKNQTKW